MDIIGAIVFFLGVPVLGVVAYVLLCLKMRREKIEAPPYRSYFFLFAAYGELLMLSILIALYPKQWSGLHSLGCFFLIFIAPIVTLVIAWRLHKRRTTSPYHRFAYFASAAYPLLIALLVISVFIAISIYDARHA